MPLELEHLLNAATNGRGDLLADLTEDQWFERKSARISSRQLADTLIGFANAEGGTVVVGIHDRDVEGIDGRDGMQNEWRQAPADFTVPPVRATFDAIECLNENGQTDHLLLVHVAASDRVHTNVKDEAYLRIGDETRRLTFDQRRELEFDKGQSNFETTPARLVSRNDLDDDLLGELGERLGVEAPATLLRARGLMADDGRLTIGAVLLFTEYPQAELPEAFVRVLRYRGSERGTGRRQQVSEDVRIEGPLPHQVREAQRIIADLLPVRRALGPDGTFTNVGAIPRDAWLEGLVNAVTHRSYSMMGDHVRVEIFDDRLEIESPGRFPGIVDLSEPEDITRFARNPRVARILSDFEFGQELGEGIRRMFEEMRLAGLAEPQYRQTSGSVRVSLSADPVDRALEDRLPPTARDLVRSIRQMDRASTGDLVEITGRSRPVVLRDLRALVEENLVEWVGTSKKDPRAYWRLRVE